ncbi:MAG: hypothetical protein ACM3SQ_12020 [Betaproteobacteria bacterium]
MRELLDRIRTEYTEMPALRLTAAQARRLWHLDEDSCDELLATLVRERFLWRTPEGTFLRAAASPAGAHRPSTTASGRISPAARPTRVGSITVGPGR